MLKPSPVWSSAGLRSYKRPRWRFTSEQDSTKAWREALSQSPVWEATWCPWRLNSWRNGSRSRFHFARHGVTKLRNTRGFTYVQMLPKAVIRARWPWFDFEPHFRKPGDAWPHRGSRAPYWAHPYGGWKKSCTTLDGWKPWNNGINQLSTGAGFRNHPQYHWNTWRPAVLGWWLPSNMYSYAKSGFNGFWHTTHKAFYMRGFTIPICSMVLEYLPTFARTKSPKCI